MPFFTTLTPPRIADEIGKARQRVVLACAGVQKPVAEALLAADARLPGAVKVILDVAPNVARLGYGDFECIQRLHAAGADVRHQPGLRIGVLICDSHGWAFASAARLVEADPTADVDAFNAVALTEAQILQLCMELPTVEAEPAAGDSAAVATAQDASATDASVTAVAAPLVGERRIDAAQLQTTATNLELAPPQPFDLARQANMYSALVQFVDLEFRGFKLESRKIQLPSSLPILATRNQQVRKQLTAAYRLFAEATPSEVKEISSRLDELRDGYLIPVGRAGRVILKSARADFERELQALEDELEKSRATLTGVLQTKIDAVIEALVPELARAVLSEPPPRFRGVFPQSQAGAEEYVRRELRRCMPDAKRLTAEMRIHHFFKDVTYEVLKDKTFSERVLAALPASVLQSGLLTEQTVATAGTPAGQATEP